MKESEYFKRAATDAAFRRSEIKEQRSLLEIGKVLFWFLCVPLIVFTVYLAFTSKAGSSATEILFLTVLSLHSYGSRQTTIAALEAMENSKPSPELVESKATAPHR